jgi:glycosyltransferase involved in cell wall biosynthesis
MADESTTEHDGAALYREPPAAAAEVEAKEPPPTTEDTRPPIMWWSNAPWVGSGYGTQSALFGPRVAKLGYRLAFGAFHGLKGTRQAWTDPGGDPFIIYPGGRAESGNDVLAAHTRHWFQGQRGIFVLLSDPWVIRPEIASRVPCLAWTPVDHDPLIPRTRDWFYKSGSLPLAMSRFGQCMIGDAGIKDCQYAPHAFDPEVFGAIDRAAARKALGIPLDAFCVGMCAANVGVPSRKCFSQAFSAFAEFKAQRPDAVLYLHTSMEDPLGENLPALADALKIRPLAADQYGLRLGTPAKVVAATLAAFDVLLNPSMGEGFGVPLIEAQACGTPCIVTDFSSMPEVAPKREGNWTVEGQEVWTVFESFARTPIIESIVDALLSAYDEPEVDRVQRRISVHEWAYSNYQADDVVEKFWKPVLPWALDEFKWREKRAHRLPV